MHGLAAAMASSRPGFIGVGSSIRAVCPNCDTGAELVANSARVVWPSLGEDRHYLEAFTPGVPAAQAPLPDERVEEQVWECSYCSRTTILHVRYLGTGDDRAITYWQVWPEQAPRELPDEAPAEMRSLYREASQAENAGALRGAAGLYRAAVEALLKNQGIEGPNLEQRIDALQGKGVDSDLVRDLHEARLTGNWSLHDGVVFSAEEIADLAQLIHDAVRVLYVQPAERERMREARAARRAPPAT
jgi:hypothetical protein